MNKFSSVIALLLASAAAANGAHNVMVHPRIARIVNAVETEPAEVVPCMSELKDFLECLGQPCIECFLDIVKDLDESTTCESLASDEGFCSSIEGCVETCGQTDCTDSEEKLEGCAEENYPDAAGDEDCDDLCEGPEQVAVLESDSQHKGPVAVASGFRGTAVSSSAGSQTLTVLVEKATDLEGEDTFSTSDVYVVVGVYKEKWGPDEKIGEQKTKVVKSLNPVFNEEFQFTIPSTDDIVVKLDVFDEDPGSDDEMGDAEIELEDYSLSSTPTEVVKVVDHHFISAHSKVYVSLKLE